MQGNSSNPNGMGPHSLGKMKPIVKNAAKYAGKYVTTKSFASRDVVTFGSSIIDVYERAKAKGIAEPVVIYIPDPNIPHIYQMAA